MPRYLLPWLGLVKSTFYCPDPGPTHLYSTHRHLKFGISTFAGKCLHRALRPRIPARVFRSVFAPAFLYPFYLFFTFKDTFSWTLLWWRTLVRNVSYYLYNKTSQKRTFLVSQLFSYILPRSRSDLSNLLPTPKLTNFRQNANMKYTFWNQTITSYCMLSQPQPYT